MIVYEKPADYRGTIEVYRESCGQADCDCPDADWRWRCKSRNGQILASGEGYKRRAGALNAIDAQYGSRLPDIALSTLKHTVPWRLVIHDRHGNIEHIGAVY